MVRELIYSNFLVFRGNTGTTLLRTKKQFYELLFVLGAKVINLNILVVTQQKLYVILCLGKWRIRAKFGVRDVSYK
jgi:hypothetical protein